MTRVRTVALCIPVFLVAAVLGCCGFGRYAGGSPQPPAASAPFVIPITGSAVVTADGSRLRITTGAPACESLQTASVTPGRWSVRLVAILSGADCRPPGNGLPEVATLAVLPSMPAGRQVVDATTGRVLPVFPEKGALHRTGSDDGPYGIDGSAAPGFGGAGARTLAEAYLSGGTNNVLWVVQTTAPWQPPSGVTTKPVTVRGHAGRAAAGLVVWRVRGLTDAVSWQLSPGAPMPSTRSILAVANALVRT